MNNPYLPFLFFVLFWFGLIVVFSFWGGWRQLAQYYRYAGQAINKKKHMQSVSMRAGMGYRNCLTIGASFEGLYMAILFPFRAGHPPLFIPWHDIKIKRKSYFGFPMLELTFVQVPSVILRIPQELGSFLEGAAGRPLPVSATAEAFKTVPVRNVTRWITMIAAIIAVIAVAYSIFFVRYKKF